MDILEIIQGKVTAMYRGKPNPPVVIYARRLMVKFHHNHQHVFIHLDGAQLVVEYQTWSKAQHTHIAEERHYDLNHPTSLIKLMRLIGRLGRKPFGT
jgi:hypothetical protein